MRHLSAPPSLPSALVYATIVYSRSRDLAISRKSDTNLRHRS